MADVRGKEDERGKIPTFKCIDLTDLAKVCEEALDAKKLLFIADMTGKATTFFAYQGGNFSLYELHGLTKQVVVKKETTYEEAQEKLRARIVNAAQRGI